MKLFLKRPTDTQELVQQVLSLATQDSDNPDLRDRGFIYWRLLSTDPAAAKDVVLAEKPLISEETDLLEPTLLDELICHIASLASVYHKPPTAFVEGMILELISNGAGLHFQTKDFRFNVLSVLVKKLKSAPKYTENIFHCMTARFDKMT